MNAFVEKYKTVPVQAKAAFCFLMCSFLQKGISVLTTPIFTRLLNTTEYGQFNVFNSWMGIVSVFVTLNLFFGVYEQGVIKFSGQRAVFSSALQGLTTLLVLCWTIVYALFHDYWNKLFSLTTVQMLAMLVMIWTASVFTFWSVEQRTQYRYRSLFFLTIAVSVAKPVVGIVAVTHAEDKVTARILGLMLVELIAYSGLFVSQMYRGKKFCSLQFWKYALGYNIPLIPHYLSQTILNNSDRIMIRNMVGASEAGIYGLASSLALVMMLFNSSLMQTIGPWTYQKIKNKKEKEIAPVGYTTLILIAMVNLILIIFAPEAVAVFAPKEYYNAIWVIPPVAMSGYFIYTYGLFSTFAFYYEQTGIIMWASIAAAFMNVVLNYIFIGLFGYVAAGYTTLLCYMIYSVGHFLLMKRTCRLYCGGECPYAFRKILEITLFFLFMGFGFMLTYNHILLRYGVAFIFCIIIFTNRRYMVNMIKELFAVRG